MSPQPTGDRPTAKQLRYLRQLAQRTGQTFAYPHTSREASREIARLKHAERDCDRLLEADTAYRERLEIRRQVTNLTDAAAVQPFELTGHGASATWKHVR